MEDREPRIEDFPLEDIPAPMKEKVAGDVPEKYYSLIGKVWKNINVILVTPVAVAVMFFIAYVCSPPLFRAFPQAGFAINLLFHFLWIGVLIGFPVSAIVSRRNARTRYENALYEKKVWEYNKEKAEAEDDRKKRFEQAHALWLARHELGNMQDPLKPDPLDEDEMLIVQYQNSEITGEIARWIAEVWTTYLRRYKEKNRARQAIQTTCLVTVENTRVCLKIEMAFSCDPPLDLKYVYTEHRGSELKDARRCRILTIALSRNLKKAMDYTVGEELNCGEMTIALIEHNSFIAKWQGNHPDYLDPMRKWPE